MIVLVLNWLYEQKKFTFISNVFAVIEKFEEAKGRNPGEISIEDLPAVLNLKKELCEAQVFL